MTYVELERVMLRVKVLTPPGTSEERIFKVAFRLWDLDHVSWDVAYAQLERALQLGVSWEHLARNA